MSDTKQGKNGRTGDLEGTVLGTGLGNEQRVTSEDQPVASGEIALPRTILAAPIADMPELFRAAPSGAKLELGAAPPAQLPRTMIAAPPAELPRTMIAPPAQTPPPAPSVEPVSARTVAPAAAVPAEREGAELIGRTLCGYRVIEKLAEGGMGEIYLGEHLHLGRRGALKMLKLEYCQNDEVVERFTQEARAVNSIRHKNIVDIYDFGRDTSGRVFFVMEFLDGEALDRRIARGPLPWTEALPILEQILRALDAAHAKGFVHRDLKPENLFLRRRGDGLPTVKVLDFGIAKLIGLGNAPERLTRTGSMIGTPHYMSPEQINGANTVDCRTDIYSLGVIIYEMFSGERPFGGETLGAIIKEHLMTAPPRLAPDPLLGVPAGVTAIVDRMLVKDVDHRYSSIGEVLSDLRDVAQDRVPTRAQTLDRERPLAAPLPPAYAPPVARRRGLALAVTGAAIAIAGAVAIVSFRGNETPSTATPANQVAPLTASAAASHTAELPAPEPRIDTVKVRTDAESMLRGSLREVEPRLRVEASDALGKVKHRPSVPDLLGLVSSDPDQEVRGHAAAALGAIDDMSVMSELERARGAAAPALQVWLDQALMSLGHPGARKRLAAAAGQADLAISFKAALALADASEPGDETAIGALVKLAAREAELQDIAPYAGVLLLARLAELRHAKARETLLGVLDQPDEGARVAAAEALARIGDAVGKPVLERALSDETSPNRIVAARALIALGDYTGFGLLTDKLSDSDPAVRRQAAAGLGDVGEEASLRPLIDLLDDGDKAVRIAAAASLLTIVGLDSAILAQASVDWARSALDSEDWAVRSAAARTLGDIPQDEALPLLAQAIADPDPKVRRAAARSAGKMKGSEAARAVGTAARREKDPEVKAAQVVALAGIADPAAKDDLSAIAVEPGRVGVLASGALLAITTDDAAVARLDQAIADRKVEMRLAAAESAALAKNVRAIPALATGVKDHVFDVRFMSAEGLADYAAGKDDAVAVLTEGLAARRADIQARAQAALRRFGVQPTGGMTPAQMLESTDAETRRAAIAAIVSLPWSEASGLLRRAVADPDLEVRRGAVDALSDLADTHPGDAQKIFKALINDADPLTRAKAQAQLSRLVEKPAAAPAPVRVPAAPVAPVDTVLQNTREIEEAIIAAETAKAKLEEAVVAVEQLCAEIEDKTHGSDKDDPDLESIERLVKRIEGIRQAVTQARGKLDVAVGRAREIARGAGTGLPTEQKDRVGALEGAVGQIAGRIEAAIARTAAVKKKAESFARDQTADPALYVTSAKTAIATGKLSAARSDLKKAEKLYKAQGEKNPEIDFAYGELHSKLALQAGSDDERKKQLGRAKQSFDKFAKIGRGFQATQAKERSAEIAAELAELGGN